MLAEIIAFIVLCVIAILSYVRGYQRWKQGKLIQGIFLAALGAYTVMFIIKELGEWL